MYADEVREFTLAKKGTTEETPFGPNVLVYKVVGKMYATLTPDDVPPKMNLKCDPDRALELRDEYDPLIVPGYHMNKRHWNTVTLDGSLPVKLVKELITHSYELVVAKLPKNGRGKLSENT